MRAVTPMLLGLAALHLSVIPTRAVPPPRPLEELLPEAAWVVVGELGPLRDTGSGPLRLGDIRVSEVLKSPPGTTRRPRTLTLQTTDPRSGVIGVTMYPAGTRGVWILTPSDTRGVYEARNPNSLVPASQRDELVRLLGALTKPAPPGDRPPPERTRSEKTRGTADTLTVAADGSGDCRSITEAVRRAAPGARINVRPGVYHESVVVDRALTLEGDGPADKVIVQADDGDALNVKVSGVTVRRLTLRCRAGAEAKFYAADLGGGNPVLEDCVLTSNALACLGIHGQDTQAIVRRCWIARGRDAGVLVYGRAAGRLEDCHIFNNGASNLVIDADCEPVVLRCVLHGSKRYGLVLKAGAGGDMRDCQVYGNAAGQVSRDARARTLLTDCRVEPDRLPLAAVTTNVDAEDKDVDPALRELVVTFDRPMDTRGWHVAAADEEEHGRFPRIAGKPGVSFRDPRTFVIPVKLKPETRYAFLLNDEDALEFQSADGVPLDPVIVTFRTGAARPATADRTPPPDRETRPATPDKVDTSSDPDARVLQLYSEFVTDVTLEKFRRVREAVRAHPRFNPDADDLNAIADLMEAKKYDEARAALKTRVVPSLILSPRLHMVETLVHEGRGDAKAAAVADRGVQACLRGILLTGDGGEKQPYRVLTVSDIYDVLAHLKKKRDTVMTVRDGGRTLDRIGCTDGSTLWFDVSDVFSARNIRDSSRPGK